MRLALRAFLPAALLGGLLVPVAGAQQMYTYSALSRNGNTIFSYVETDLWSPVWYCGWGCCGAYCWERYTSFAQATLYLDYDWMGGYWYQQQNGWASAWVWRYVDIGAWSLQAQHALSDVWYQDEYCGSYWIGYWPYERYPWPSVTVNPEISISSAQYIEDGGTAYFAVWAELGNPLWYWWSYQAAPGGGNNPHVIFWDPDLQWVWTDAHWYAYPNGECTASRSSQYTITATVGFDSGTLERSTWSNVIVPWSPGGETYAPQLLGPVHYASVNGLWRVLPQTAFTRSNPFVLVNVSPYSQFHQKVWWHELVQVEQYEPGGIKAQLYNPTDLRNAVINLTHATEAGLLALIQSAFDAYYSVQHYLEELLHYQAEGEAYSISDIIPPHYLYQN